VKNRPQTDLKQTRIVAQALSESSSIFFVKFKRRINSIHRLIQFELDINVAMFKSTAYVGNSAAGFGERERTTIQGSACGANGGWSFALNFCFFLFKQKENRHRK
jgi:hypothetical protein